MKIICQTCQSKYTVSDEKVQGKTVKIKCRKCGATIMVNSSGASQQNGGVTEAESFSGAAPVAADAGDGEGGAGTYTVNVADGDQRTMTLAEVVDAYNESTINAETYIWADGQSDWLPLGQIDVIVNALHAGAGAAPVAEPSVPMAAAAPMAAPSLGSHLPNPASSPSAAAAAAAPRAARREVGRGGRDLFGAGGFGQSAQPAADDVATSAPLFSAGMHAPPPSSAGGPPPGQRDENSVLFSLSALTAKAGTATAPPSQTTATKDDSGLIDLRALSAGASAPAATSNLVPDNAALFPLGVPAAPPMTAPILGLPSEAPKKNNTPIFIGLGLVIALVAVFGTFMVMKGGEEPIAPPVAATTAAAPPPPVEPTPAPTAEASAAPTASATASATATAVAAGPRPRGGGGGVKTPPKETPSKAGTSGGSTPPAKTPPKSNCNCPPGDLMCAMKCSTK